MVDYVWRDGQRLTPWMLYQINRLDADCRARFGVNIKVRSGLRTYDEQKAIFLSRYVLAGQVNGRRVYDTRWWNGQLWYRVSAEGTVAQPGTSNHEIQGSNGAVDIYDTGADNGITVRSSTRGQWIRSVCRNYDMEAEGDNFGEGWHFKCLNILNAVGGGSSVWSDTQKQEFLNSLGYDTGAPGWGPKCAAATGDFQKNVGLEIDNQFGPDTTAVAIIITNGGNYTNGKKKTSEIQQKLNDMGFWAGPVDNEWGNKTSLGTYRMQKAKKIKADAQFGDASIAACWPPTPPPVVTPPVVVPGENQTKRPIKDIQKALKVAETGVWDLATATAVFNYQKSKFIDADYYYGQTTDGFLFPPTNFGFGFDYSFARPDLQMLADRGGKFVARYLWKEKYDDGIRTNKGLSKAESDAIEAKGMQVVHIYEEDGKELNQGRDAGIRVANEAERFRKAQGLPAKPIYFNVDYDAQASELPAILDALRGVAQVIGLKRVGLYAGYNVIKAAFDAGVITFGMQTYAWSGGLWDSRAQLRQWSNGQYGGSVDFQYAMAAEYGQTAIVVTPEPEEPGDVVVTRAELLQRREDAAGLVEFFDTLLATVKEA